MIVTHHYNPWFVRGKHHLHGKRAFDGCFDAAASNGSDEQAWTPRVDVREEATRFVILADVPGVDPSTIEIRMDDNVLSLKGERKAEDPAEGGKATRLERNHGRFDRRFVLPDGADAEAISASGKHGVLQIVIPKKAQTASRRIVVNA